MNDNSKKYIQKFRPEWKHNHNLKNWILEAPDDTTKCMCKFCKCILTAKYSDIIAHSKTKKHISCAEPFSSARNSNSIDKFFIPATLETQKIEAGLAFFVCMHSAIKNIDHLSLLFKKQLEFTKNKVDIKLHKTKCTNIIINIFGTHFREKLEKDIGNSKYSILIDESTDISVVKYLGIGVRYLSRNKNKFVTTFLSLEKLENASADGIVSAIKSCLNSFNLNIHNMCGIASDNASVMTGVNNGVYKKLKESCPHLIHIRCVCHSIQLAVSSATTVLPNHLEFIISETYNFFSKSSVRQQDFQKIYSVINDGNKPLKLIQKSNTRWLSIERSVSRILQQWPELKTFFGVYSLNNKDCYLAELLYDNYKNEINHAYLLFLQPLLNEIQTINKTFESNVVDVVKLIDDLCNLVSSLVDTIILPEKANEMRDVFEFDVEHAIDEKCYLGYAFELKIRELEDNKKITKDEKQKIRQTCINFITKLICQLKNRLPENVSVLRSIKLFSIENIMNLNISSTFDEIEKILKFFNISYLKISLILRQISKLSNIKWIEKNNTEKFWIEVNNYKDASGEFPFKDISDIVILLLSLPWSNAEVERIFSQMNIVKTKIRNRMSFELLISILHTRYGVRNEDKCCDYELPDSILKKICTMEVYKKTDNSNNSEIDNISDNEDENDSLYDF